MGKILIMKLRKIITGILSTVMLLLLINIPCSAKAKDSYEIRGTTGVFKSGSGNCIVEINYDKDSNVHRITVTTKAKGWAAVGFGQTAVMKNAEIIIADMKDGKCYLEHHYGTNMFSHKNIMELDKTITKSRINLISYKQNGDAFTFTIERPAELKGVYYKDFLLKTKMSFMYALGNVTELSVKHFERGAMKLKLPN